MTGFERFWQCWPPNNAVYTRKGARKECLRRWVVARLEGEADAIVKHVAWMKTTAAWAKADGEFIPAPLVYLNQSRWDGADIPEVKNAADETAAYLAELRDHKASPSPEVVARLKMVGRL